MSQYNILSGDVLEQTRNLPDNYFDGLLTDPPYGLEFMGRDWDKVVPGKEVWAEVLRVMKPGAFGLIFGGTRTFHRLAVALEDAGFELRDTCMYIFGSGFPKSHDVSKAIDKSLNVDREVVAQGKGRTGKAAQPHGGSIHSDDNYQWPGIYDITIPATSEALRWQGYGTSLKPAYEPILLVRKPTQLTYAQNVLEHGTGALNIDGTRVPTDEVIPINKLEQWSGFGQKERPAYTPTENTKGRWPANIIHDGSDEVVSLFPTTTSGKAAAGGHKRSARDIGGIYGGGKGLFTEGGDAGTLYGDSGSAARFFYTAKASKSERNAGLQEKSSHPTVKPLALTKYLATLLLQPTSGKLFVPFSGSGSEIIGGLLSGWGEVTGIEREAEYIEVSEKRILHHLGLLVDTPEEKL